MTVEVQTAGLKYGTVHHDHRNYWVQLTRHMGVPMTRNNTEHHILGTKTQFKYYKYSKSGREILWGLDSS